MNILGVGTSDSKVKVYDVRSLKLQQQYSAHEGPVNQVSFHPSGSYLVSASQDKTVRLFDLLTVKPICTLYGHEKVCTEVINNKGNLRVINSSEIVLRLLLQFISFIASRKTFPYFFCLKIIYFKWLN